MPVFLQDGFPGAREVAGGVVGNLKESDTPNENTTIIADIYMTCINTHGLPLKCRGSDAKVL